MLSLLLASALAVTPPHASKAADVVAYVPRLDRTGALMSWLSRAGERAVVLRPSSWQSEFHPLLHVDPTSAQSLEQNGLSPSGSATVSEIGESRMTCATLGDAKKFEKLIAESLSARGDLVRTKVSGKPVLVSQLGKEWIAGAVVLGHEACSVASPHATRILLQEAIRLLGSSSTDPRFRGVDLSKSALWVATRSGPVGMDASTDVLTAESRMTGLPLAAMYVHGDSPYASAKPSGLLFARTQVTPSEVARVTETIAERVRLVCRTCDPKAVSALASELTPHLTGHLLVRADRFEPGQDLRSPQGRFFALKLAALAQVDNGPQVLALLSKAQSWPNARAVNGGIALATAAGTLTVGVRGAELFLANDSTALQALLDLPLGKPAPLAHALEASVDPARVTQAFSRVSLLDVVGSRELAAMFALGTEVGPLFAITRTVNGFADPSGPALKLHAGWTLLPAAETPPVGEPGR